MKADKKHCETCGGTAHGIVSHQIGYNEGVKSAALLVIKSLNLLTKEDKDNCQLYQDVIKLLKK